MAIRKLDLTPYEATPDFMRVPGAPVKDDIVQTALILRQLLLHPSRELNGEDLLRAWDVAKKLEGDSVLLEENEWQELVAMLKVMKGFGAGNVVMVERVLRAPIVPVKEA